MGFNESRYNSVFIKESRSAHAENMKSIIAQGIIITIVTVLAVFAVLSCTDIKAAFVFALMCAGAAVCIIAMAVRIIIETRRFRRFAEFIYTMDESEFDGLNAQAVGAESDFDLLYMLDKYIYLCPKHVLIPYCDIKDAHFSTYGILSRKSGGAAFYVYCHSGKKFIVGLNGNYFKYRGSEETFEAMLNSKIRKSQILLTEEN
ncbi:MAG: hypothetical protein HDT21_09995 [Ruminococcus sp.]|nr:hypothetical protein [Ruminococcus sp.]